MLEWGLAVNETGRGSPRASHPRGLQGGTTTHGPRKGFVTLPSDKRTTKTTTTSSQWQLSVSTSFPPLSPPPSGSPFFFEGFDNVMVVFESVRDLFLSFPLSFSLSLSLFFLHFYFVCLF